MTIVHKWLQYRFNKKGVRHGIFNREGPGVVTIHLLPPKPSFLGKTPYLVILDGFYILPINYAWATLLGNFLEALEPQEGRPLPADALQIMADDAVRKTSHTYPTVAKEQMTEDLRRMIQVFLDVSSGKTPEEEIGGMSIKEYAQFMTAPHRMDLMVSAMTDAGGAWNCNLQCVHCYAAGQEKSSSRELSTKEWKSVIQQCKKAGITQLTFTGGEPTMRADLVELVAYSSWFVTRLNTNGLLLTKALCNALYGASLDNVQATLYSSDPKTHNELVGSDGFDGAVSGIKHALEAGLSVNVNTPLSKRNAGYLATLQFLHSIGVRMVTCSGLIQAGRATTEDSIGLQLEQQALKALLKEAVEYCHANEMEISFTSPGWLADKDFEELALLTPMCGACLSNMAVAPDGTVVPCQSWLDGESELGNLLTDSWKAIWAHPKCDELRLLTDEESLECPFRNKGNNKG